MPVTTRPLSQFKRPGQKEIDKREILANTSVDDLKQAYQERRMSVYDYNYWLREKARLELDGVLRRDGIPMALWKETVKNTSKSWNDLIEAFQGLGSPSGLQEKEKTQNPALGGVWNETHGRLYYGSLAIFREVQLALGWLHALGDVTQQQVENMALNEGASLGMARVYGFAAGTLVALPVIGLLGKGFAVGVRTAGKIVGGARTTADISKEAIVEGQALKAIVEGMKVDGVKDADKLIETIAKSQTTNPKSFLLTEGQAKTLGRESPEDVFSRITREVEKEIGVLEQPSSMVAIKAKEASLIGEADRITKRITKDEAIKALPALARKFGIDLTTEEQFAFARYVMTERQLYGHLKMLENHTDELPGLAKQALEGSQADQQAFVNYVGQLFSYTPGSQVLGSNKFRDLLMHWNPEAIAQGQIGAAMKSFAEDLSVMSPEGAAKLTFGSQEGFIKFGQIWPGIRELYFNVLLPFSWAPSFIGNALATSLHVMERATGALFVGDSSLRQTVYAAKAAQLAFGDAIKAFGEAYAKMDAGQAAAFVARTGSRLDYIPNQIPGTLGRIVNAFGTSPTMGMDNLWKVIDRRIVLYENAINQAVRSGAADIGKAANSLVVDPRFYIQSYKEMEAVARKLTFQSELGWMMSRLRPIMQWGPGVLYFPFVKTGVNLLKYSWDRTPGLQLMNKQLYIDIANGGAVGDEAVGRLILSNMWGHFQYELAKDGYITGSGPLEPKTKASWEATHHPYSWATPKGWIPFDNLDPMTAPIGFIADFAQISDQMSEPTGGKLATAAAIAMLKNFPNRTWWRNASDLIDQIQGLKEGKPLVKYGEQATLAPGITGVTGGSLMQRVARIVDPIQRDTQTLMDLVKARTPYFSKDLPPKVDGYGDPIIPPQALGGAWFGLFSPVAPKVKPPVEDRVKQEGDRLQATLPRFGNTVGGKTQHTEDDLGNFDVLPQLPGDVIGVDITLQQKYRWAQFYRELLRDSKDGIEAVLINTRDYQDEKQTPKALQKEQFEGLLRAYKQGAWQKLLSEDPTLLEKVLRAKAGGSLPKIGDPKERARLQLDLELSINAAYGMSQRQRDNLLNQDHMIEENTYPAPKLDEEIQNELH